MADNILRTRLEIDEANYSAQLQANYVKPGNAAAQDIKQATRAAAEEFPRLANVGKASLERIAQEGKRVSESLKPTFAETYARAFNDINNRAQLALQTTNKFLGLKESKGQFDLSAQSALVASTRIRELIKTIQILKNDASQPNSSALFKQYEKEIRAAESALLKLEARQKKISGSGGITTRPTAASGNRFNDVNLGNLANGLPGANIVQGFAFGGGVGAAVAAVNEAIQVTKQLATTAIDAGLAATKMGGDFEVTKNSLTVFSGSVAKTKEELEAINITVASTTGLRLEDAEAGYTRLRALGFEAETARKLVAGFAKQKIISGADNAAIERAIINVQQLSSEAGQARDLKEIIKSIPSTKRVFQDAFKTSDTKQLLELLEKNPDEFFNKLADQLEKTTNVQGGLNSAQVDFANELTRIGREFSEPFIPELTASLKALTEDLGDNQSVVRAWGENVRKVLELVSAITENKFATIISYLAEAQSYLGVTGALIQLFNLIPNAEPAPPPQRDFAGERRAAQEQADRKAKRIQQQGLETQDKLLEFERNLADKRKTLQLSTVSQELAYRKAINDARQGADNPLTIIRNNANAEEEAVLKELDVRRKAFEIGKNRFTKDELKEGKDIQFLIENTREISKLESELAIKRINARKAETEEIKRQAEAVKKLRNDVQDFFLLATDAAQNNNLFLKIFSDAETAVNRFEERFKLFGVAFAREAAKIELTRLNAELGQTRFQSGVKTLNFQDEAKRLENLPERKTIDFRQAIDRIQFRIDNLIENFSLSSEIQTLSGNSAQSQISSLANSRDARDFARQTKEFQEEILKLQKDQTPEGQKNLRLTSEKFQDFQQDRRLSNQLNQEKINDAIAQIKALSEFSLEGTGVQGQSIIANAVANIANPVKDIRTDANSALFLRNSLIEANKQKIAANNLNLANKLDDQRFIDEQRSLATQKLQLLQNATGFTAQQKNQEFLNITGELGNENLNPLLRRGRIEALKNAADFQSNSEKEARDALNKVKEIMERIDRQIGEKGLNVSFGEVPLLNLEVSEKLSVTTQNGLPATSTASDTGREMGLKNYRFIDNR